jgi:predicted lipoprotein with Yx(FWY)xxD motif
MTRSRRTITVVSSIGALLMLLAACASTSAGSSGPTNQPTSSGANGVTVKAATVGLLGTALVDGSGRTLYALSAEQGGKLVCTSSTCVTNWPPLLVPAGASATAGSGVDAAKLGTIDRSGGEKQVTYNGWPVYLFKGDSAAGQSNGQGIQSFGGTWHPLAPSGRPIVGGPSTAPSSSSSNPYGYGY